jgi:diaminohydroxyphosphoribosylaminopyrimidine deaminase/5-amino-6-(5-phosphoribosylamino)uracil reductase
LNDKIIFRFMSQALELAKKSQGKVRPNPSVGAIVVRDEKVVGKGFHKLAGKDHAEVIALKDAGALAKGADLYVTLEPCSHQGKTPPCTNSIISAGITNVFVAMKDPNPLVNGLGIKYLKASGINVTFGIMEDEAKKLNLGFSNRMIKSRPYIRSKIAISLDGKTSLFNGQSQWITSEASRIDVQKWRLKSCAILTGKGTINSDNPSLSVRSVSSGKQPLRIILDSHLRVKVESKILQQSNVVVIYGDDQNSTLTALEKTKAKFIKIPLLDNKLNLAELMTYLNKLQINELWVEAGPNLNGELLKLGLIDELVTYIAPNIMGGNANSMFNAPILEDMKDIIKLSLIDLRSIGDDIRIQTKIRKKDVD